jgi:putative ABC transport system permease protein
MIRYFFKLAFRNIRKYKVNTLISLLGLTVGLASFILIASYIRYELSFNKDNENYERIYVAKINAFRPSGMVQGTNFPYPLVEKLIADFPEVECGVRLDRIYSQFSIGDNSFFENTGSYADNSFFEIFTIKFLSGDRKNPLSEPYTIVLNETAAKKYFGSENPIGKSLLMEGKYDLKVTAVIEDLPVNSDFNYDFFVSMKTKVAIDAERDYSQDWNVYRFRTIFMLDKNCDIEKLNEKIEGFFNKQIDDEKTEFFLSPLSTFHLKPHIDTNTYKVLAIYGLVAIFILIIASINFINLSIANAANRVKEISIRRIVGSKKSSLIFQQIGESVLLAFISFDLAYLLAERLFPNFNAILGTQIPSTEILSLPFILGMFSIAIMLGVISGIFPAIRISRIHPLSALTGKRTSLDRIGIGKKALIVIQYAVSVMLIISTTMLYQQFNHIKNIDLGFEQEALISLHVGNEGNETSPKLKSFKDVVSNFAGVQNVSLSTGIPFYGSNGTSMRKENASKEDFFSVDYNRIEASFFDTYGIEIMSKKDISESSISSETRYCYINQTAAKALDFKNPIGERILIWEEKYEIIGVYKDFHNYSVQMQIPSQVLILTADADKFPFYTWMVVKCDINNVDRIIEQATKTLRDHIPDNPFSFFSYGSIDFKKGTLNKAKGIEKTFGIFTFIAIVIASMGIFGLVALSVKHKTKEIGIRKTLGSSVFEIYKLIAREYIFLAILGNVLAWAPAWYVSNKILQDFAYRIDISVFVFVIGFISSLVLTFITIAFHTIKAARTNPVEALRYE